MSQSRTGNCQGVLVLSLFLVVLFVCLFVCSFVCLFVGSPLSGEAGRGFDSARLHPNATADTLTDVQRRDLDDLLNQGIGREGEIGDFVELEEGVVVLLAFFHALRGSSSMFSLVLRETRVVCGYWQLCSAT